MSGDSDSDDKQFDATPRKLEEARRKGELPRSADITATAAYTALLIVMLTAGAASLGSLGEAGIVIMAQADRLAPLFLSSSPAPAGGLLSVLGSSLASWLFLPAAAALATLIAIRGLVFAPDKLTPKLSRLSPLANAKNKFGRSGLFEFAKSFAKLLVISALLWLFLVAKLPQIMTALHLAPGMVSSLIGQLMIEFMALTVLVLAAIGAVDFLWQRQDHLRRQRMSHKEMRDEMKQAEGDPHTKQQRRQRGQEIATNRMLADVPNADVVIVNPTHYAVALKWNRDSAGAPVCTAKGVDEVALRIRERAVEAGVPIRRDAATARALHAAVGLGDEVRPEHYGPVAAAIRFAEAIRTKARSR